MSGGFDMRSVTVSNEDLGGFFRRNRKPRVMKGILSSTTVIGVLVALVSKFIGLEVSRAEAGDVIGKIQELWPILLGILADLTAAWHRVKATRFDVPWWSSKVFWAGVFSAVMTLIAALGIDVTSLQAAYDKTLDAWPALAALAGSLMVIVGRFTAKRRIAGGAAHVNAFLLLCLVSLTACSTVPPVPEVANVCPTGDRDVRRGSCVAIKGQPAFGGLFAWAEGRKLWKAEDPGEVVRVSVAFLDGSEKQQSKAWSRFQDIDALAPGLEFVRVAGVSADIRVSFACSGHWSYIGTWARSVAKGKATMNLELSSSDPESEWNRVGWHEVLHAIAFGHEHQSPIASIPWNEAKVIDYYRRTQGWTEQQIREQVLNRAWVDELLTSGFDPKSIMMYPVPADLTDGKLEVGWNTILTERDKQLLREAYPAPQASAAVVVAP